MALSIAFSEPATVNTAGAFLAAGAVYDSGHTTWVYLGFRSVVNVASVQYSTDAGLTWNMVNMPSASSWRAVAYASTLGAAGRLVAVGNGVSAWSDDGGQTWAAATSLPEANNWSDVQWWAAKGIFVACATSGTHRIMTSADGKSWTNQTAASALSWEGLNVSATTAVCLAFSTVLGTQFVQTSTDGVTWTLQTHTNVNTRRGAVNTSRLSVGYSASLGMFTFTGQDAGNITKVYRSTDEGVTWTASGVIPTLSNTTARGLFWLPAASSWYLSCADLHYGESTDGDTWAVTALPTTHSGYTPVGWDNASGTILGGTTLGFDTVLLGAVTLGTVVSASPSHGPIAGGTVVTLTGTGLAGVTSVTFGGTAATDVVPAASGLSVTCLAPAHASGTVSIVVIGIGTLVNAYAYVTVTKVTPASGTFAGGTPVTITGAGFDLATGVTFGGTTATAIVYVSGTTITCVTPAHALGLVDVVVAGVGTGTGLYTYAYGANAQKLPPIPYQVPVTQNGTLPDDTIAAAWVRWLQVVKERVEAGPFTDIPASNVIGILSEAQIPALPWGRITKTGASVADLQYPGAGGTGQYLGWAGSVPVWRTFGATPIPANFDPGTCTIGAAQFLAFPGSMTLAVGEALTMGVGAVLRIF